MRTTHIVGYLLLVIGVLIIGYALFASYGIFAQTAEPPQVFDAPEKEQQPPASFDPQNIEASIDSMLQEQLANVIPPEFIVKTLNLFAWSIFAGLLIFGGAQLASLGIKLLRVPQQEKPN